MAYIMKRKDRGGMYYLYYYDPGEVDESGKEKRNCLPCM